MNKTGAKENQKNEVTRNYNENDEQELLNRQSFNGIDLTNHHRNHKMTKFCIFNAKRTKDRKSTSYNT